MTTSGRPFELIDVRVVGDDGEPVTKGSNEVSSTAYAEVRRHLLLCLLRSWRGYAAAAAGLATLNSVCAIAAP